jgi:WD40 repeat protein
MVAGFLQHVEAKEHVAQELMRIRLKGCISFVALSSDGKTLAYGETVYPDGKSAWTELVLVDLTAGKELKRSPSERGLPRNGVFSPDGKLLAIGSFNAEKRPCLWDVEKWKPLLDLDFPEKSRYGNPLVFSPGGDRIAGFAGQLDSGIAVVWEAATGRCRALIEKEEPKPPQARHNFPPSLIGPFFGRPGGFFAEDGSPFLVLLGFSTTVWDVEKGRYLQSFQGNLWWLRGCRNAPSGRVVALPKYQQLVPINVVPYQDGTFAVLATPIGFQPQHWVKPDTSGSNIELCRLEDFKDCTSPPRILLSLNGRALAAAGQTLQDVKDSTPRSPVSTLIVWDISRLHAPAAERAKKAGPEERERLWASLFKEHPDFDDPDLVNRSLAHEQQIRAHQAMFSLVSHPKDAVPYLREWLGPPADLQRIPRLIEKLDSDEFKTREQAAQELERMRQAAAPFLEKALAKQPSPETRRRLEGLLGKIRASAVGDELRLLRIIDVLEHINTAEARELLRAVAEGGYGAAFTEEAKRALQRNTKEPK